MKIKSNLFLKIILILLFLNSCMNQKPSNSRLIKLFDSLTECEFPKSGKIVEKDNLPGLNDGWEVAIIKVEDVIEFEQLLNEFEENKIMNKRIRGKYGFGFSSKLANKNTTLMDSIYYTKPKELFTLGYIKSEKIIVFEKEW